MLCKCSIYNAKRVSGIAVGVLVACWGCMKGRNNVNLFFVQIRENNANQLANELIN